MRWACPDKRLSHACSNRPQAIGGKQNMTVVRRWAGLALAATLVVGCATGMDGGADQRQARNVILFISDGASNNTWDMASYWEHGRLGAQPYDTWPVRLGMTTYPLHTGAAASQGAATPQTYDTAAAWDRAPTDAALGGQASHFAGYHYLRQGYTDSAAAGTALATGVKTYNQAISVDDFGRPLSPITDDARSLGKATGVVSSVPFSHATPAVFAASNASRNAYGEIAAAMIASPRLDVIIGAGHPEHDANGAVRAPDYEFLGAPTWQSLKAGIAGRTLVQDTAAFQAMARGEALPDGPMIGIPRVGATLQFARSAEVRGADPANPSGVAFNPGLPDLKTLTLGALNMLGRDGDGFFLMVEGGAVDWAAHANDTGRIIEEQADFNAAVRATMAWLEARNLRDQTLVIVLTDHGNGLPMGPQSDRIAFQPVENRGRGVLPGVKWHHPSHTNENTRLWATGPGSIGLVSRVRLRDREFARRTGHNRDGATIDNVDVHAAIRAAMTGPARRP
jgi:alkaline phosphatase